MEVCSYLAYNEIKKGKKEKKHTRTFMEFMMTVKQRVIFPLYT